MGLKNIDSHSRNAEVSCVIGDRNALGSGIGLIAMHDFVNYVFEKYPLEEVYAVRKRGVTGNRMFSALGFIKSESEESEIYAITKSGWSALNQKLKL